MFFAAIGSGIQRISSLVGTAARGRALGTDTRRWEGWSGRMQRQEAKVHLGCEALGEICGGYPAGEGDEIFWSFRLVGILRGELDMAAPTSTLPCLPCTHSSIPTIPLSTSLLPRSRSPVSTHNIPPLSLSLANNIPLSSKHSLIAPTRYALLSKCRAGSPGAGISPSEGKRLPPGKTCAEGKERDVVTRWRRRM